MSQLGESISANGCGMGKIFQFDKQLHARPFWDAFQGRWMLGDSFSYPERQKDLPKLKGIDGPFGAFI